MNVVGSLLAAWLSGSASVVVLITALRPWQHTEQVAGMAEATHHPFRVELSPELRYVYSMPRREPGPLTDYRPRHSAQELEEEMMPIPVEEVLYETTSFEEGVSLLQLLSEVPVSNQS